MAKTEILNNDAVTVRVNAEPVIDAIENAVENVEEVVERVVTVTKNNPLVLGAVLLVGIGVGGAIAYKVTDRRVRLKYEQLMASEIHAAKEFYRRLAKEGEFESPESAVATLVPENVVDSIKNYQGRQVPYNHPEQVAEMVVEEVVERTRLEVNVFEAKPDHEWDYDVERVIREEKPDSPYVIHFDEFTENETLHDQATLTYFAQDQVLVDERDAPIDNVEYTVGEMNLRRFGHGSHDSKVVYIRNERLGQDFEVNMSSGSYNHEVLGLGEPETELKHSQRHPNRIVNPKGPRRFRMADE